jgi:hypothetical protein
MTTATPQLSQNDLILNHLKMHGHITPLEALFVYRIQRLAARVEELRGNRYMIDTDPTTDAMGQPYTRYTYTGVGMTKDDHVFVRGTQMTRRCGLPSIRARYSRVTRSRRRFGFPHQTFSQAIKATA